MFDWIEADVINPDFYEFELESDRTQLTDFVNSGEYFFSDTIPLEDIRAKVVNVEARGSGLFDVHLTKAEESFIWNYDGSKDSVTQLNDLLGPLGLYEVFFALDDYRFETVDSVQYAAAMKISSELSRYRQEDDSFFAGFYSHYLNAADHFNNNYLPQKDTQPVEMEEFSFFVGKIPPAEKRDVLLKAMRVLPQAYIDALNAADFKIELYSWEELIRENPLPYSPIRNGGFGVSNGIQVNIDIDPLFLAFVVVHEIGHFLDPNMASNRSLCVEYQPDAFRSHHNKLKSEATGAPLDNFLRRYSEIDRWEGFADGFATYHLGKANLIFRAGFQSFNGGIAIGYHHLLDDFRSRDPGGYLFIATFDQYMQDPDRSPEEALAYPVHYAINTFLDNEGGVLSDAAEDEWKMRASIVSEEFEHVGDLMRQLEDLARDEKWGEVLASIEANRPEIDPKNLFPLELFELEALLETEGKEVVVARRVRDALLKYPNNEILQFSMYNVLFDSDPTVKNWGIVSDTIDTLHRDYPKNLLFTLWKAYQLKETKKYMAAYQKLVEIFERPWSGEESHGPSFEEDVKETSEWLVRQAFNKNGSSEDRAFIVQNTPSKPLIESVTQMIGCAIKTDDDKFRKDDQERVQVVAEMAEMKLPLARAFVQLDKKRVEEFHKLPEDELRVLKGIIRKSICHFKSIEGEDSSNAHYLEEAFQIDKRACDPK
jgi:hypothetical protein